MIPGDGIGKEAAARRYGFSLRQDWFAFAVCDDDEAHGRMFAGTPRECAIRETVMTRHGTDRILRFAFAFAFDLARSRPKKHMTSATKSNGVSITMPFRDERVRAVAADYPDMVWDRHHIDILTAHVVPNPDRFDVVVASNRFGDVLSDLGPACTGTIGIAPSGTSDPERAHPSVSEPAHGSAPDIAGLGLANPIGQIWSGAMMLEHLGETEAAAEIVSGIERVLSEQTLRTRDLGGSAGTEVSGKAVGCGWRLGRLFRATSVTDGGNFLTAILSEMT